MQEEVYEIKRIEFLGRRGVPILLQAKNGPCPLLAIANVLLLSNRITLAEGRDFITLTSLVELLAGTLFDLNNKSETDANQQRVLQDCIELLPKLSTGLDVNLKFSSISAFEYDANIALFDMFGISLYHGWTIDNGSGEFEALRDMSYNQLVERSMKEEEDGLSMLAREFLNQTPAQLTYSGLTSLYSAIPDRKLAVFFRNNHFSTLFKYETHIYLLCTDQAFSQRAGVAWERLTDINGDTELCSPVFGDINAYYVQEEEEEERALTYAELAEFYARYCPERNQEEVILPMLSYNRVALNAMLREKYGADLQSVAGSDEALARQLQMQEAAAQQPVPAAPPPPQKESMCVLC